MKTRKPKHALDNRGSKSTSNGTVGDKANKGGSEHRISLIRKKKETSTKNTQKKGGVAKRKCGW